MNSSCYKVACCKYQEASTEHLDNNKGNYGSLRINLLHNK